MSSNTWTRAELLASCADIETTVWRAVEAQHFISTMKLVDSREEQEHLEQILEDTKPPFPQSALHYLLFTPFRYTRSNAFASRFRRANASDGVFYASASPETAIAEMAFYRLLFFAESPGTPLPANPAEYTVFGVQIAARPGLDLTRPPMSEHHAVWMAPDDYTACQALAESARAEGVQAIGYLSVRDPKHRLNYAILTPAAFAAPKPITEQTWRIQLREDSIWAKCEAPPGGLTFSRSDFDIESRLMAAGR